MMCKGLAGPSLTRCPGNSARGDRYGLSGRWEKPGVKGRTQVQVRREGAAFTPNVFKPYIPSTTGQPFCQDLERKPLRVLESNQRENDFRAVQATETSRCSTAWPPLQPPTPLPCRSRVGPTLGQVLAGALLPGVSECVPVGEVAGTPGCERQKPLSN